VTSKATRSERDLALCLNLSETTVHERFHSGNITAIVGDEKYHGLRDCPYRLNNRLGRGYCAHLPSCPASVQHGHTGTNATAPRPSAEKWCRAPRALTGTTGDFSFGAFEENSGDPEFGRH
jgi:hypothetical protein